MMPGCVGAGGGVVSEHVGNVNLPDDCDALGAVDNRVGVGVDSDGTVELEFGKVSVNGGLDEGGLLVELESVEVDVGEGLEAGRLPREVGDDVDVCGGPEEGA